MDNALGRVGLTAAGSVAALAAIIGAKALAAPSQIVLEAPAGPEAPGAPSAPLTTDPEQKPFPAESPPRDWGSLRIQELHRGASPDPVWGCASGD